MQKILKILSKKWVRFIAVLFIVYFALLNNKKCSSNINYQSLKKATHEAVLEVDKIKTTLEMAKNANDYYKESAVSNLAQENLINKEGGLIFYDYEVGTGKIAQPKSNVIINYFAYFKKDKQLFDAKENLKIDLAKITDPQEVFFSIIGMKEGGERKIEIYLKEIKKSVFYDIKLLKVEQ